MVHHPRAIPPAAPQSQRLLHVARVGVRAPRAVQSSPTAPVSHIAGTRAPARFSITAPCALLAHLGRSYHAPAPPRARVTSSRRLRAGPPRAEGSRSARGPAPRLGSLAEHEAAPRISEPPRRWSSGLPKKKKKKKTSGADGVASPPRCCARRDGVHPLTVAGSRLEHLRGTLVRCSPQRAKTVATSKDWPCSEASVRARDGDGAGP